MRKEEENAFFVVFSNQTYGFWKRFLRRGFRHCFVIERRGSLWVSVESARSGVKISVREDLSEETLAEILRRLDCRLYRAPERFFRSTSVSRCPFALFTCVELTKKILHLKSPFIWTPYQLSKYLSRKGENL